MEKIERLKMKAFLRFLIATLASAVSLVLGISALVIVWILFSALLRLLNLNWTGVSISYFFQPGSPRHMGGTVCSGSANLDTCLATSLPYSLPPPPVEDVQNNLCRRARRRGWWSD